LEVHQHTHTSRKKWTHYFWEFLMLFLAVTLGFFVENVREHYVERHRVKQYAFSLVNELKQDTAMINLVMFRIKRNIRMTDTLSAYLKKRELGQIKNIELYILSAIDRYPPYTWNRATIDQLKNSGSLRYFSNAEIVKSISSYDALTHHMDEDQKADDEMANRASQLRSEIVDMDYSKELTMGLRNNIDSMMMTTGLLEIMRSDSTKLLAKELTNIRIYLNEKMNVRKHLMIRSEEELPRLKKQAENLILLLKEEFHFN